MKIILCLCLACVLSACGGAGSRNVSFRETIQPLLSTRCVSCHGSDHPRGKIVLASYQQVMAAKSVSGRAPVVVPGSPNESKLFILCATDQAHFRMPPDTSAAVPLAKADLEHLRDWIKQGAKDN
jgi:hypothetical protein